MITLINDVIVMMIILMIFPKLSQRPAQLYNLMIIRWTRQPVNASQAALHTARFNLEAMFAPVIRAGQVPVVMIMMVVVIMMMMVVVVVVMMMVVVMMTVVVNVICGKTEQKPYSHSSADDKSYTLFPFL